MGACRQAKEVQVTLGSRSPSAARSGLQRMWAGLLAQRHWAQPCLEGLLGIHLLRDSYACLCEALRMSRAQWWALCRCCVPAFGSICTVMIACRLGGGQKWTGQMTGGYWFCSCSMLGC